MLRQDYSQINLSAPVRTSCLGKKVVLPAVGKLLTMGNWINHDWSTEGWWEKQSLLAASTASEVTTHQSFVLVLNSSGLPAQHWSVWLGQKLVMCWEGQILVNSCVMKWTSVDSLQTWSTMMKNLSLSYFAGFFCFHCLFYLYLPLKFDKLLLFDGTPKFFFLTAWPQVVSFCSVTHTIWQMCQLCWQISHLKCPWKTSY